jgi:hypothetical protein
MIVHYVRVFCATQAICIVGKWKPRLASIAILCFCAAASLHAEVSLPPAFLGSFVDRHKDEIVEFGKASPACRLDFRALNNGDGGIVVVRWVGCTFYCGTAGCRFLLYAKQQNGTWNELSDTVARDVRISASASSFGVQVELSGASCGMANSRICLKRGAVSGGKLTVE